MLSELKTILCLKWGLKEGAAIKMFNGGGGQSQKRGLIIILKRRYLLKKGASLKRGGLTTPHEMW